LTASVTLSLPLVLLNSGDIAEEHTQAMLAAATQVVFACKAAQAVMMMMMMMMMMFFGCKTTQTGQHGHDVRDLSNPDTSNGVLVGPS
jgi:hypothetical protein